MPPKRNRFVLYPSRLWHNARVSGALGRRLTCDPDTGRLTANVFWEAGAVPGWEPPKVMPADPHPVHSVNPSAASVKPDYRPLDIDWVDAGTL